MSNQTVMIDPEGLLREFFVAFKASLDFRLWIKLIEEETRELLDAARELNEFSASKSLQPADDFIRLKANLLKELADVGYVVTGSTLVTPDDEDVISEEEWGEINQTLNEAVSALNVVVSDWGFTPDQMTEAFLRVHRSNMSKLGDDGKPIRREDGKIMKGPNYRAPDLTDLV